MRRPVPHAAALKTFSFSRCDGIRLLLLLATVLGFLLPAGLCAQDFETTSSGGEVTITGYTGAGGNVTIPDMIGGEPVVHIGPDAFRFNLTLTGIAMPDSVTAIAAGAFTNCRNLESVALPKDLTTVGEIAFLDCSKLTEVSIPDGVTTLGPRCFEACELLATISLPASLASIGERCFSQCFELDGIALPEGLTTIEDGLFFLCISLQNIRIPASVTNIGPFVFEGCESLQTIEVDPANTDFSEIDGVLFDAAAAELIAFPGGRAGSYAVPAGVTSIADRAFSMNRFVTAVSLPPGVTQIGERAFFACRALEGINLPDGLTEIREFTFTFCQALPEITIPEGVTTISASAFQGCSNLRECTLPSTLRTLGGGALSGTALECVRLPDGLTTIEGGALSNSANLTSVNLPETLTSLGNGALRDCPALPHIVFPSGLAEIPESVVTNCPTLQQIVIRPGPSSIADSAFSDCTSLRSITIPAGVTDLASNAFEGCRDLVDLYFSGDAPTGDPLPPHPAGSGTVHYVTGTNGWGAMFGGFLTAAWDGGIRWRDTGGNAELVRYFASGATFAIPTAIDGKPLTRIESFSFSGSPVSQLAIPDSVVEIRSNAFAGALGLLSITVAPTNPSFSGMDGVLFNKDNTSLLAFPAAKGPTYSVPEGVTVIGSHAFYMCRLERLDLPPMVEAIGVFSFFHCSNLREINFAGDAPSLADENTVFVGAKKLAIFRSARAAGWTSMLGGVPVAVLPPPAELWQVTSIELTSAAVILTWTDPSPSGNGYAIESTPDGTSWTTVPGFGQVDALTATLSRDFSESRQQFRVRRRDE